MKKLFLIWSILLMAAITIVACEKREEATPPASSENMQDTDSDQGTDTEQGTGDMAPSDQGGGQ